MISDERIEELRRIYKKEYGEQLTMEEARDMGRRLVELYTILMKPLLESDEAASPES